MVDYTDARTALETFKLRDIATFIRGVTFKPDDIVAADTADAVWCFRTKNVQSELDLSDVWSLPPILVRRKDQIVQSGDILVSSANSWNLIGKCCWIPRLQSKATFGGFVSVLRAFQDKVDPRYLYRWFSSDNVQIAVRSFGRKTTNISNLDIGRCLDLAMNLPPLPEQRRIAAILDQADALRAKRRAVLAQLDEMAQAIFVEMFGDAFSNPKGWPEARLSALIENGPQNGLYKPSSLYGAGTPILRIDAFYDGVVTKGDRLKQVKLSASERQTYKLQPNDIVINRVNSMEYLGKSALMPPFPEETVFESNMMRFSVDQKKVRPEYVIDILQTPAIKEQIRAAAKHAVNQSSINQQDVLNFRVLYPPVDVQDAYVSIRAANEHIQARHKLALQTSDTLFASLQHRAFAGEL